MSTCTSRRKAAGLCVQCGKRPPITGKTRCEDCTKKRAKYGSECYANRKATGLCSRCGKKPARVGKTTCEDCHAYEAECYFKLKASGLCVCCGKKAVAEKTLCKTCATKQAARNVKPQSKRYAKLKNSGLCVRCGKKAVAGKTLCKTCAMKQSKRVFKRKTAGLCVTCGKKAVTGKTKCQKCIIKCNRRCTKRKTAGLCVKCGKKALVGSTLCETCVIKKAGHVLKLHTKRKTAGLCVKCGKKTETSNSLLCVRHNVESALRTRIITAIKSQTAYKSAHTEELIGCSFRFFRVHISGLFQPGMTFENHGEWHIDHIRPCASFDLEKPEQQKQCFHYTNLQPLWAKDNFSKGSKYNLTSPNNVV